MKLRQIAWLSVLVPVAGLGAPLKPVVNQLLAAVALEHPGYSPEQLGKMAVLSGSMLLLDEPGISKPAAVTQIIQKCYQSAERSKRVGNIMACYIMDRKVTSQVDSTLHVRTGVQTRERFSNVFEAEGINDQMKRLLVVDFEKHWRIADDWLSSRNLNQVKSCVKGINSPSCG